ncbi:VOC family protein [Paraburkholderia terrae]
MARATEDKGEHVQHFDYAGEDTGNLVLLEHVNLTIPDQRLATAFYITGLGLTRDPYMMTGVTNMWINVGRSQIHLPRGVAQRLRGRVALVVGELEALIARLKAIQSELCDTEFEWTEHHDRVEVTCPWGNRYECLRPHTSGADAPWSGIDLGIAYVQLDVPTGSAPVIASFYREAFDASVDLRDFNGSHQAVVDVGTCQQIIYAETPLASAEYDGHHIQIYVSNFSKPYAWLAERSLVYGEEPHQYRFADIVDTANGNSCFKLEHEVRSLRHPLYARSLVNRNPNQDNRNYKAGADAHKGMI